MEVFKIKITAGSFTLELEGPAETVIKQFNDIKEHGIGKISTGLLSVIDVATQANNQHPAPVIQVQDIGDQPTLEDLALKDIGESEREWVLIYGYYASNFGKTRFSEASIRSGYEKTNRWTESRKKNFANNLKGCVSKSWFSKVNQTEYIIKPEGMDKAKTILKK